MENQLTPTVNTSSEEADRLFTERYFCDGAKKNPWLSSDFGNIKVTRDLINPVAWVKEQERWPLPQATDVANYVNRELPVISTEKPVSPGWLGLFGRKAQKTEQKPEPEQKPLPTNRK